ncbi:PREDICTED: E3 ubiquitin-protein ligase PRT1-like [Camelina sativa]|uniref:E3 ubiquitin-protein ligase PRT1-like n=1 Tax=Camelina sativa TaxID=90675 RepID=A0ABM0ZCD7_CAMSA|nr:PREDICTED: E3 ubiquitin-protein ligase PRT1-like [Camelina sativa]
MAEPTDAITVKNDEPPEEEISDQFLCCVCLELLYKPIVLSCGHLSCFWCVHKSMNGFRESHCPICRDPYVHFPSVCQKLHFLLKKIYPLAHKKREEQVLKEEQEQDCFSPQIDVVFDKENAKDESGCSGDSLNVSDKQKVEECSNAMKLCISSSNPCIPSNQEPTDARSHNAHENDLLNNASKQISKDDLLCSACKELLVRPVVLNCGHVYCEGCVVDMAEESEKIKCQECNVCDPRGFPKVCLILEQLLVENFPDEYNSRRSGGIQKTLAHNSKGNYQNYLKEGPSLSNDNNSDIPWLANPGSNVHIGAGCDSCGVFPIIGDRYRCKDCKEEIGYDLCKECYETPLKVPGRFNQQHTPDHRLELQEAPQLARDPQWADVPQLMITINSIAYILGPSLNSLEGVDTDEGEEGPPGSSNESSSTE